MRADKITRVAQSAKGKARDVRHWKRRGARFRHPRRQQGSATVRAIHYKMDHARGSADDITAGGLFRLIHHSRSLRRKDWLSVRRRALCRRQNAARMMRRVTQPPLRLQPIRGSSQ